MNPLGQAIRSMAQMAEDDEKALRRLREAARKFVTAFDAMEARVIIGADAESNVERFARELLDVAFDVAPEPAFERMVEARRRRNPKVINPKPLEGGT